MRSRRIACLASAAILVVSSVAFGQVTVGARGGLNLANMSYAGDSSAVRLDGRTLWTAGFFVDIPVLPHAAIQPEALFAKKGSVYFVDERGIGRIDLETYRLDYIDLSALVRVDLRASRNVVVPYGYAGPTMGVLLGATATSTHPDLPPQHDIMGDLKRSEVGIVVGGGVRVGRVTADLRYTRALTSMLTDTASRGMVTMRNEAIQILGGVRF